MVMPMGVPATIPGLSGVKVIVRPELGLDAAMGACASLLPDLLTTSAVGSTVGTSGGSTVTAGSTVGSIVGFGSVVGPTVGSVTTSAAPGVAASCISETSGSVSSGSANASAVVRGVKRLSTIDTSPSQ
jgi:hypothetical protein